MLPKRILLKLSGESLSSLDPHVSDSEHTWDPAMLKKIAHDVSAAHQEGIEIAIVVGGGNIFRGAEGSQIQGIDRVAADNMGMLATVLNGLALSHAISQQGISCRVLSAIPMPTVCEAFIRQKAERHLYKGRVVICVAGTGNPYFTTDSAAVLRASELGCQLLLKATKVLGVFDSDPVKNPNAYFLPQLTYQRAIEERLQVMDAAALALARDNHLDMAVFSIYEEGGLLGVLKHTATHSRISN